MKKLFTVALVAICMFFMGNVANAQTKIGYIDFDQTVQAMPDMKTIQTTMQAFSKTYQDVLDNLTKEYQSKGAAYQSKQATMNDAARTAAQAELTDIQNRAQQYNTTASQAVEAKSNELIKPVADRVRAAISTVAKEKGYTYVINTAVTNILLVSPEADDLTASVKLKLGIK